MSPIDLFFLGDIHCADKAPSSRVDNYCDTILSKLSFCIETVGKYNGILVIAGDFFHAKRPHNISHFLVNKLIAMFSLLGEGRIFGVKGNHDIDSVYSKDSDSSPLETLVKAGVLQWLEGAPINIRDTISLNGIHWSEAAESTSSFYKLAHFELPFQISVFHQYVIPDGVAFAGAHLSVSQVISQLPHYSIFGHYHDGFPNSGMIQVGDKKLFNVGALARDKASTANLIRSIKMGLLRFEQNSCQFFPIDVPFVEAGKVFDLQRREETKTSSDKIKDFVDTFFSEVKCAQDVDLSHQEELVTLVRSCNLPKEVESRTIKILETVQNES